MADWASLVLENFTNAQPASTKHIILITGIIIIIIIIIISSSRVASRPLGDSSWATTYSGLEKFNLIYFLNHPVKHEQIFTARRHVTVQCMLWPYRFCCHPHALVIQYPFHYIRGLGMQLATT